MMSPPNIVRKYCPAVAAFLLCCTAVGEVTDGEESARHLLIHLLEQRAAIEVMVYEEVERTYLHGDMVKEGRRAIQVSRPLGLARIDFLNKRSKGNDASLSISVLLDNANNSVYYKINGKIAIAPPGEAAKYLERVFGLEVDMTMWSVSYVGAEDDNADDAMLDVFELQAIADDDHRIKRVHIDIENGFIYRRELQVDSVRATTEAHNVIVGEPISKGSIMGGFTLEPVPVMSLMEMIEVMR